MIFGIDFSIKSPGMTVLNNENMFFHAFPRIGSVKEDCILHLQQAGVNLDAIADENPVPKKATIAERERSSLIDAIKETKEIISAIKAYQPGKSDYVGIEGFSFGSSGNRLTQLSGYQWLLRYRLIEELGFLPENFFVFSPMTVKATAGKGNLKKDGMIAAFIQSTDITLQSTLFHQSISTHPENYQTKRGVWLKPIDDIVDSYWVMQTTRKTIDNIGI